MKGERVEGTWTHNRSSLAGASANDVLQRLLEEGAIDGGAMKLVRAEELTLVLNDQSIPLGWVTTEITSAKLTDASATRVALKNAASDDVVAIDFEPASNDTCVRWRGTPENFDPSQSRT